MAPAPTRHQPQAASRHRLTPFTLPSTLRLSLNVHTPRPHDPWVTSLAEPYINQCLRQAGLSSSVADKLTSAPGLLAAQGVLQVSQSVDLEPGDGWADMQAIALPFSAAPTKVIPKSSVRHFKEG